MSVSLTLENICRSYIKNNEQFMAVSDVNMSVNPGEFLTFLGPSGCGKTTTLRMIAGFETPTSGHIIVGGKDVTSLPANERKMGFVFQNYALFPHMKIFDNVAYGLKIAGVRGDELKRRVREGLDLVGLQKNENHYPNQLSGGEQQRVALARVLVLRPELILMDEPLSNLDAKLRLHMRTEIRRLQQELKLTCLYVTHDQKEALTMSDRIMVMNKGRIEQIGTPMQLYEDPASPFVADFIGQANLIQGQLEKVEGGYGYFNTAGRQVKARMGVQNPPIVGADAWMIIRPENLSFASDSANALPATITNRLFEGDRIDYEIRFDNVESPKDYTMSVPYLPGMELKNPGTKVEVGFIPEAAVLIKR